MNNVGALIRVGLADGHPAMIHGLEAIISDWNGFEVTKIFATLEQLNLELFECDIDVLVTDLYFDNDSSLAVLKRAHAQLDLPVVMYTICRDGRVAHELLRAGVLGFVDKSAPIDVLRTAIARAVDRRRSVPEWLGDFIIDHGAGANAQSLSAREHEVLASLVHGKSPSQIAADEGLSPSTVSTFLARIKRKLNVTTTSQLIRYAIESGLYAPRLKR